MSEENSTSSEEDRTEAELRSIPLKPGKSQKRRSKLNQVPEPADPPVAPAPPPPTASEPPPASSDQRIRRMRLKRSGQLREDLFAPEAQDPTKREDEY